MFSSPGTRTGRDKNRVRGRGLAVGSTDNFFPGDGVLRIASLELGSNTDTTLVRSSAGNVTIEGNLIVLVNSSPTFGTITTTGNIELGNASDTTISRTGAGAIAVEGQTIWTALNDGTGSGLDADLLDGKNTGTSGNVVPLLDGVNTWSSLQLFQLAGVPVRLVNNTDNASVQGLKIEGDRATMAANDEVYESYILSDSGGAQDEIARITGVATNVTAGATQAGRLDFSVRTADVLAKEVQLTGTSFSPSANDGNALGTTALNWGDLFLATGAVINYNNGNVTITHAANILTVAGGNFKVAAGTTTLAPLQYQSGTNLTTPAAGDCEFDGVQYYHTIDTTSKRGAVAVEQYFHLTADGGTISTIANFFGATSNISLVASAHYIIDIECWFLNTTAGTVTWTFTNSSAPTSQNIHYEMSPITGLVAPAGSAAAYLSGDIVKDATAAKALTTTGTLTTAVDHYVRFRIYLINNAGTSLKIQATKLVGGTITPRTGSWWRCRRVSPSNIGTFAA